MFRLVPAALLIALGIAFAGWQVGQGFVDGRAGARLVTVKGLAEMEVTADTAIWPLRFVAIGNDLAALRGEISRFEEAVRAFLTGHGIDDADIRSLGLDVKDLQADPYRSGPIENRFIVTRALMVRSQAVANVASAAADLGELLRLGVVMSSDFANQGNQPIYQFTRLNELKPDMIREATANARAAAEQFALDSGSRVGAIRQASQGVFQIFARDEVNGIDPNTQMDKIVRVVSTLDYELID